MQDHLNRLFDAALDAVIGMDAGGHVTAWNLQAETTFGWSREEALGRSLGALIVPERLRDAHEAGLSHYLQTGEGPVLNRRIEVTGVTRENREFPVELTIIPIEEDRTTTFFAFLRDISARKDYERRLAQRGLEAEVLWEASSLVAAGGSFEDLLKVCLERICRIGGWQVGHVCLPDNPLNPVTLASSPIWHVDRDVLAGVPDSLASFTFRRGEGLAGLIWESGSPQWIEDIRSDPRLPRQELLSAAGLTAAFGFPIRLRREVQAVLEFFAVEPRERDEHLLLMVRSLGEQLARVLERQQAEVQREALVRELSHRVNNSVAVIRSLFRKSCEHVGSLEELRAVFEDRLMSLGAANNLLAASDWQGGALHDVAQAALDPYCATDRSDCEVAGPKVTLSPGQVMSLSLVLHELATNAAKYGAFSVAGGAVRLEWEIDAETRLLRLRWSEAGGPLVAPPQRSGFGSFLLATMIERAHGGRVTTEYDPAGIKVAMDVPLS